MDPSLPTGSGRFFAPESALTFYRASDLLAGQWRAANRVDLTSLKEAQGEGVALGADNMVFLAGEGGGKGHPARSLVSPARRGNDAPRESV